jgi:hypothetical protein
MKTAFQYATVELMPYPELGEFVIVGVVAVGMGRLMRHRLLEAKRTKRLTHFFPEIERKVFTQTLSSVSDELQMLEENLNAGPDMGLTPLLDLGGSDGKAIFRVLTSAREGTVRIRARGVVMVENVDRWIDDAFERFVMRIGEAPLDPAELVLTNRIRRLLTTWKIDQAYKETPIRERHIHATFPFAYTPEGAAAPVRAIKPLHLGHDSPTRIFDHGDRWLQKVRRLRQFNCLPERVIFPVQLPRAESDFAEERTEVAHLLIGDFRNEGIDVIEEADFPQLKNLLHVDPVVSGGLFG